MDFVQYSPHLSPPRPGRKNNYKNIHALPPPYNLNSNINFQNNCHPELVSGSIQRKIFKILKRVQNDKNFSFKPAFTLAEVLITLVIIGVIAAITVPTLINKTNKQEYVSKLKKTYSTLAQATNLIIAEEGTPRADKGGWASSSDNMYKMYKKYLINAKECGSNSGCFNQIRNKRYKTLISDKDGGYDVDGSTNYSRLILSDGAQILFYHFRNNCSHSWAGTYNQCGAIWVDINGEKKPNKWGRDFFSFSLKENGLVPTGCDVYSYCKGTNGYGCACVIMRENAMNY